MLKQRIITALLLAPLALLVILWVPHLLAIGVLALLVLAGAWEWAAFAGFVAAPKRAAYVAAIGIALAACWVAGPQQLDWILLVAGVWWVVALCWILFLPSSMSRPAALLAGFLVLVPAWVALSWLHAINPHWVLFVLLLVVAADVGAYFGGRSFGRHKLAPRVSPGKTWEGVAGGLVVAALMALAGVEWFDVAAVPFLAVCAITVLASIVGDLTESLFKRHAGLKDSGNLLPGHGGVLDRVDSVTAAAPVFLLGVKFLGLVS